MNLSDKFSIFSGYAFKEFNTSQHGVPIIKIGNITADGRLNVDDVQYSTQKPNEKFYAQKGDFLIALSGATTGKSTIYSLADKQYLVNQRVGIIRPINKNPRTELFFKYYLQYISRLILHRAHGSAQPNISPKDLAKFTIPSVDENEQAHIGELLSSIEEGIRVKETQLKALDELIQSRFTEMFGNLFQNHQYTLETLGEVLKYEQPTKYIVANEDYDEHYKTPVLTAGKTFVLGYTNETENIFYGTKENVIIFDDFTCATQFVNFNFKVKSSAMKILHANNSNIIFMYYALKQCRYCAFSHKRHWISTFAKMKMAVPPLPLQNKFAQFVQQVEKAKEIVKIQIKDLQELLALKMDEYLK